MGRHWNSTQGAPKEGTPSGVCNEGTPSGGGAWLPGEGELGSPRQGFFVASGNSFILRAVASGTSFVLRCAALRCVSVTTAVCLNRSVNIMFDCVRTECVAPRATAYGACVGPNLRFLSLSYGITAGSLTRTLRGQP